MKVQSDSQIKCPSFLEFLDEAEEKRKRGRPKGSFKWDPEDRDFIDSIWKDHASRQAKLDMNGKIKSARKHLSAKIERAGAKPRSLKLSDLYAQARELGLDDLTQRLNHGQHQRKSSHSNGQQKNWQKFEKDVAAGIQNLLDSGFYLITREGGEQKKPLVKDPSFKVEVAGGGLESDIRVSHGNKKFYVECKLDFESSRYFKYNLELVNGDLVYNHRRYLQGRSPEERKQIDRLFLRGINLNEILNEILADGEIEKKSRQFFQHLDTLVKSIKASEEFNLFSKPIQVGQRYPEGFAHLAKVFDEYLQHYATRYNQIVDQMFACLVDDPKLQSKKAQFKLDIADGDADCAADELEMSFIEELDWDEDAFKNDYSSTRFYKLSETLKLIEIKFGAILVALGKRPRDFNALFKLSPKQKLMYFFKAFLSSTRDGRKPDPTAGIEDFATASISPELAFGELENDELGTMQICGGEVESEKIAKRIAMFYALKDHCAYIQIGKTIFSLDPDFDPLQLDWIPSFAESVTRFDVRVMVSDDLSAIRLRIKGLEPQNIDGDELSFIQSDSNYVAKERKRVEIEISK